ncbi:Pyrimidine-specific ribonucleoside hydrolase RihB [Durusdinium trenchii]|uniref:Pyrimidine-specific ribonucleoside hydrolase RihB n=1 Tax=Durusdinium trenchii TaxID=1381693 RepID=A0ABP0IMP6_9DINO
MATILRSSSAQLRRGLTADDLLKELKKEHLRHFLGKHGFPDAHSPRELAAASAIRMECVYPVHVAAERGDDETLRLLWEEGCDMEETDDYGRTPMDLAYAADVKGSHRYVLELLRRAVPIRSMAL